MVVHGQRFSRTLSLVVTTSNTCRTARIPNETVRSTSFLKTKKKKQKRKPYVSFLFEVTPMPSNSPPFYCSTPLIGRGRKNQIQDAIYTVRLVDPSITDYSFFNSRDPQSWPRGPTFKQTTTGILLHLLPVPALIRPAP